MSRSKFRNTLKGNLICGKCGFNLDIERGVAVAAAMTQNGWKLINGKRICPKCVKKLTGARE